MADSEPMEESIEKARQYWSGTIENEGTEEVLFEGKLIVHEILSPTSYI